MSKELTFFLIDDDEDDRELFQIALEATNTGVKYLSAQSGGEALDLLQKQAISPDYIFLDLNMPQMSGKECLTELKKKTQLAHIPVVIFSTSNDPRDITDTKKLGAEDFITKPSKISELTRILNNFIIKQLHSI